MAKKYKCTIEVVKTLYYHQLRIYSPSVKGRWVTVHYNKLGKESDLPRSLLNKLRLLAHLPNFLWRQERFTKKELECIYKIGSQHGIIRR